MKELHDIVTSLLDVDGSCRDVNFEGSTWEGVERTHNLRHDFLDWANKAQVLLRARRYHARYENASWKSGDTGAPPGCSWYPMNSRPIHNKSMPRKIIFSSTTLRSDRVYHVNEDDVRVVLSRLPAEAYSRLRRVHFNDRSRGARVLGYVNRGRREIALCALPPRMSVTRFLIRGQSPRHFGAERGTQWPKLAIRRFLLYDVFLHELGHLQIVSEQAKTDRRKFAAETKAQEFAMYWCKSLWSSPFDHPDPVHNPPSEGKDG